MVSNNCRRLTPSRRMMCALIRSNAAAMAAFANSQREEGLPAKASEKCKSKVGENEYYPLLAHILPESTAIEQVPADVARSVEAALASHVGHRAAEVSEIPALEARPAHGLIVAGTSARFRSLPSVKPKATHPTNGRPSAEVSISEAVRSRPARGQVGC